MARQTGKATARKAAPKRAVTGKKRIAKAFQPVAFIQALLKSAKAASSRPVKKLPRKRSAAKQAEVKQLLDVVNATSGQARNMWLGFLGLVTYLFVAIAGVSHTDLLLNNLVKLPIVNVDIPLFSFFIAAPALFVLVHLGLLVQHALLSSKIQDFLNALDDGVSWGPGPDKMRGRLHAYAQTQLIAGPERSIFFGLFLNVMSWTTLYGLPVLLLLSFQVRFLPYHDERVTAGHAGTLIIEILSVFVLGLFIARPSTSLFNSFKDNMRTKPLFGLFVALSCLVAIYLSVFVLTVPGRHMDTYTQQKPAGLGWILAPAKWLTEVIFIANGHRITKTTPVWKLSRNLVVTDIDLVPDKDDQYGEVSHQIRGRDLRYAILDRSDLHRVDFTGADLREASALATRFEKSIFKRTKMQGADLFRAWMQGAKLRRAQMQGANLNEAEIWQVKPPETDQLKDADTDRIYLTPFYPDAARRVLTKLEDEAVRKRVAKRLAPMLDASEVAVWAGSAEHRIWGDFSSLPRSAATTANILFELACNDGPGGYIIEGIARRVSGFIKREDNYTKLTAKALLDKKACPAAKHLSEETLADLRKIAGPDTEKPEPKAAR